MMVHSYPNSAQEAVALPCLPRVFKESHCARTPAARQILVTSGPPKAKCKQSFKCF